MSFVSGSLQRKPLLSYSYPHWSTQFNDLRNPASLGRTPDEQERATLRELKVQALFQQHTIIRDADAVNHLPLLELILEDNHALDAGIVFSLRPGIESFTELNERTGTRRAHPDRYEKVKPFVRKLDSLMTTSGALVAEPGIPGNVDAFRTNLERVLRSSYLQAKDKDLLREAIAKADSSSGASLLGFGELYDHLVRSRGVSPDGRLIKACRAAHALVIPSALGIRCSSSDQDLDPALVAIVLGHEGGGMINAGQWTDLYPRKILVDDAVDMMPFEKIKEHRSRFGEKLGYFSAARALHAAAGTPALEKAFIKYLECLEQYILAIGKDCRVELAGWHKETVRKHRASRDARERALSFGIPIIVAAAGSLITLAPIPISLATAAGTGLALLREARRARSPAPLDRLLSGTTVSLPVANPAGEK